MQQCLRLVPLRDLAQQICNVLCSPEIHLQESAILLREVFLHPGLSCHYRSGKVVGVLTAQKETVIPIRIRVHDEGIELAGSGLLIMRSAAIILEEDASILFADRLEHVHEVAAFIQQDRLCVHGQEIIRA